MLERLGFQVEATAKGQDAIDRTATENYAAILLDLGLPDVQGEDVIVAIRTREQTTGHHLPIIVNSAHAIEETLQATQNKGADAAYPIWVFEGTHGVTPDFLRFCYRIKPGNIMLIRIIT